MLICDYLSGNAKKNPDKAALIHQKNLYTYIQLDRFSDDFSINLATDGISKGDRVAILLCRILNFIFWDN